MTAHLLICEPSGAQPFCQLAPRHPLVHSRGFLTTTSITGVRCNACLSRFYAALVIIHTPELARLTHTYEPEPPVRVVNKAPSIWTDPNHPLALPGAVVLTTTCFYVLTKGALVVLHWLAGFWP